MNRLHVSLQENLVALLIFSDEGKQVHDVLDPKYFDMGYQVITERVLDYWLRYQQPPRLHIHNLLSDITENQNDSRRKEFRMILNNLEAIADDINTEFVIDQAKRFIRYQKMRSATLDAAEKLKTDAGLEEVEKIWSDLLRTDEEVYDPGLKLTDLDRILDDPDNVKEFLTGIKELDRRNIVPTRGEVSLLLGSTGMGKSWWLVHIGIQALVQRKKVLHLSFEMSEKEVAQRYFQGLFSASKSQSKVAATKIKTTRSGAIKALMQSELTPEFSLRNADSRHELSSRISHTGAFVENLRIKHYPPGSCSAEDVRIFLDQLERSENFIPDMTIIDYLGIMKIRSDNFRIELGQTFKDLVGLAGKRNFALETVHQISRQGAASRTARTIHVAEDWSLIGTAHRAYTYSATDAEKALGLARFFVDKARSEEDKFGVLITQAYGVGQFVLQSTKYDNTYWDRLDSLSDKQRGSEEDDED